MAETRNASGHNHQVLKSMTSNNELERSVRRCGPSLDAQEMVRPAPAISGVAGRSTSRSPSCGLISCR